MGIRMENEKARKKEVSLINLENGKPFKHYNEYYIKLNQKNYESEIDVYSLKDNEIIRLGNWVDVEKVDLVFREE